MNYIQILSLAISCIIGISANNRFGIRRDIIHLSSPEKYNLLGALYKMKSTPSRYNSSYSSYDYFVFLYNTKIITQHNNWSVLPYHRAFLYYFEQELQYFMHNISFKLPYCDLNNKLSIFEMLFDETFVGGNGNINSKPLPWILSNTSQLSCNKWSIDQRLTKGTEFSNYTCLCRQIGQNKLYSSLPTTEQWVELLKTNNIYEYDILSLHNAIHGYIGGHDLSNTSTVDPIFFLVYNWIDAIWALYQDENNLYYTFPMQYANASIFDGFFNNSNLMNASDVIDVRNSLHYVYDIQIRQSDKFMKWWQSDILYAFVIAVIVFICCGVCFWCLRICRRTKERSLSLESISLI